MTFDPDDLTPELRLWLRVALEAVYDLLDYDNKTARQFLFQEGNAFLDVVAYRLGYTPQAFRRRISEVVQARAPLPLDRSVKVDPGPS